MNRSTSVFALLSSILIYDLPTDSERNLTVEDIAVIMFYSNLILDPLVYGLGSSDFRGESEKAVEVFEYFW